jgi:ATP-binding cassette subfamily B protein
VTAKDFSDWDQDERIQRKFSPKLLWWLLSYARDKKLFGLFAVGLIVTGTLLSLLGPFVAQRIVDNSLLSRREDALVVLVLALLGIKVFDFVVKYFQIVVMTFLGQRVLKNLRLDVFSRMLRLPKSFFDKNPTGKLMTRVTSDVEALNELLTSGLVVFVSDIIVLVGIVTFLFVINWKLALSIVFLFPVIGFAFRFFKKRIQGIYRKERSLTARLNTYLQESISGMAVIQLFQRERSSAREFHEVNEAMYGNAVSAVRTWATFFPFIGFLSHVAKAIVIFYGGSLVLKNTMTIGQTVAFLSYIEMFFGPLRDMSEKFNIFQSAMAASEKVNAVFHEGESVEYALDGKGFLSQEVFGRIEFRDVWFAYSDENWVLKGVSFSIAPGERVALVGHTGSGKSTTIALLGRFYEIQKGSILLDGVDVREWDIQALRKHLGFVLQDVFLFSEGDDEEKKARALSLGQRQLAAFERALARNPSVLILDEATANIDTETESLVQEATRRVTRGRTAIVIAHRLSTILDSHRILVFHKGELRESGNHSELLALRGLYFDLYELSFTEKPCGH